MDIINQKASFEVSLGNGYLSRYEITKLEIGDVVFVGRLLNEPYPIYYNHIYFYSCEVVVLNDHYGVRVSNIPQSNFFIPKANLQQLTELIPTRIIFDTINVSLNDLRNVSIGTIIYLGKRYNKIEKAKLYLAGFELGEGNIVVVKDRIGLEMTYIARLEVQEVSNKTKSGFFIKSHQIEGIKNFDFKRPDRLTTENVTKLNQIHNDVVKSLNQTVPSESQFQLIDIKGVLFKDILEEISQNKNFLILKFYLKHNSKELSFDTAPTYIIQEENSRNSLSESYIKMFTRLYSEWQKNDSMNFLISYKNQSYLNSIHKRRNMEEFIVKPIELGWRKTFDVTLQFKAKTGRIEKAKLVPEEDLVFSVKIGSLQPEGEFLIVYPFYTLEPIIHLL